MTQLHVRKQRESLDGRVVAKEDSVEVGDRVLGVDEGGDQSEEAVGAERKTADWKGRRSASVDLSSRDQEKAKRSHQLGGNR